MKKETLIALVIGWVLLTLLKYYYFPFFLLSFEWLISNLALAIVVIVQIIKLIREREQIKKLRIIKVATFSILFCLTFFHLFTRSVIEKVDWLLLENKREEIVTEIKDATPKEEIGCDLCKYELPFSFPIVSNGGNDIFISRKKETGHLSVEFFVFRNFFEAPSTMIVYTNDPSKIIRIERNIEENPDKNWKIKENWYRTFGDY